MRDGNGGRVPSGAISFGRSVIVEVHSFWKPIVGTGERERHEVTESKGESGVFGTDSEGSNGSCDERGDDVY